MGEMHVLPVGQQTEMFQVLRAGEILFEGTREECDSFVKFYEEKNLLRAA